MGQGPQARLREEGVVDCAAPSVVLGQRYWWGHEDVCWILVDEEESRVRKDTDTGCSTRSPCCQKKQGNSGAASEGYEVLELGVCRREWVQRMVANPQIIMALGQT